MRPHQTRLFLRQLARLTVCAVVLVSLRVSVVDAQPVFEAVNRASGLPSDYVNAIYQDRFGFLWFGTDSGLARYDGQRVETFTADDGLPHPFVYAVQEDGEGTLWIGTFRGLARFDGERFETLHEPFGRLLIAGLDVDAQGRLLVRTEDGLARREGDQWRIAGRAEGLLTESWGGVLSMEDGRLIGGGRNGKGRGALYAFTPRGIGFEVVDLVPELMEGAVYRIADGGDGTLFVYSNASDGSVLRVRIEGQHVQVIGSVRVGTVRLLIPHPSGGAVLYVEGGRRSGVYRMDASLQLDEAPLHPGPAQALHFDYEGSLWIGTFGSGAFRLRAEHLRQITNGPAVRITLGPEGDVWATGAGVWRIDAETHRARQLYVSHPLREVHFSDAGSLWVSSGPTLYRGIEPAGAPLSLYRMDPGWVSGMDVMADTVRMSSYSGGILRVIGNQNVDTLREGRGLPTDMIEGLKRASGTLWAITRSHGAFRIAGDRALPMGRDQGLPSSAVFTVYGASDGATWFGTDRGVARLAVGAERATAMGEDILKGQRVTALFERDGYVWIVGDRTLYVVAEGDVLLVGAFPILPDNVTSINAAVHDPATDHLFLATTSGVVAVDLAALPRGITPRPRIAIRSVKFGEARVPLLGSPLAARVAPIAPGRHRVEIEFAPLSFTGPVRTEVRLNKGDWSTAGTERTIVFPELGAGTYQLNVRAVSEAGQVSSEEASLEFTIEPFWWQRPLSMVLLGLLSLGVLILTVRYASQRRLRAQIRDLEVKRRLQNERERISRDLHDHVGAQLSSLLAGVELARLEQRASGDGASPARDPSATDPLDDVEADARMTMRQLRETIWALHGASVSMDEFASRVRSDLSARHTDLRTTVTCVEGSDQALSPIQALNLFRITQEAITNALKHAEARQLDVTLAHNGTSVRMEVHDDGVFREPPGGDGASVLTGFGLQSMQARAEGLGGQIEIDTAHGTRVCVTVPAESADVA